METISPAPASFDGVACAYDEIFTNTPIGKLQRERVRKFFGQNNEGGGRTVLEINCGTGEDALWLAGNGWNVTATDASAKMITMAQEKVAEKGYSLQVIHCAFSELKEKFSGRRFDCIFSDFGGLNCIPPDELEKISGDLAALLSPGGLLVAVVMGRGCLWERFYFLVKLQFKKAFRRASKDAVPAELNGSMVPVWYYSPHEFSRSCEQEFAVKKKRPVGISIPPSYLNCFFTGKEYLLGLFNAAEKFMPFAFLSNYADHFYIELKRR